ncbi:pyridoxal phosphate-dependent transferase, partial [Paraphoma chrysanthemicola]
MFHSKLLEVKKSRVSAKALPKGAAPWTSSSEFRTQAQNEKPFAHFWDCHMSKFGSRLEPSVLKAAASNRPETVEIISLGTGRPAAEFYPWSSLHMDTASSGSPGRSKTMSCVSGEAEYDLSVALNYGYSAGSPQLLRFITEHVELIHNPAYADWECAITAGTTSALDIALQILCDPEDWVLAEEYTYPGFKDDARSLGLKILNIRMDEHGLVPDDLDCTLRTWDENMGNKPTVLYTIPSGHNPTGITQPTERRNAIYAVAKTHNLLIIEDDPYMFIQLRHFDGQSKPTVSVQSLEDQYIANLPASYLSLDTCGRVIRLDSTSKILAPGLRCGWITACSQIISKFRARTDISTVQVGGPTQIMLYKLLDECWGHDGFLCWLMDLSVKYSRRLQILNKACEQFLPKQLCSWEVPREGMFLWIRMAPEWRERKWLDSSDHLEERIYSEARGLGVTICKGSWFESGPHTQLKDTHFRMTFAAAAEDEIPVAIKRFADAI